MDRPIMEETRSRGISSRQMRRGVRSTNTARSSQIGLKRLGVYSFLKPFKTRIGLAGVLSFVLTLGTVLWVWDIHRRGLDRGTGQLIRDFELTDVRTGQSHWLQNHQGRVVVLVFIGTSCPVGDLYMPRLIALANSYSSRGVDFLAVDSNASESNEDISNYARESGATFPLLKDEENRVADQLLAERTCEVLVIDGRSRLRYRGAIDDQYGRRSRREQPEHNYLVNAIESVLAGRAVTPDLTQVVGCPIERTIPNKSVQSPLNGKSTYSGDTGSKTTGSPVSRSATVPVTYSADVAPILHARCANCHRPGQVAPFSLLTYDQARRWATSITEVLDDGRMPPWHADPRYGRFLNDRSLSAHERSLLLSWVEQGSPVGDLSRAPQPPKYSQVWSIGTPDIEYEMPVAFSVPSEGTVPIYRVHVPIHLTEDLYVTALEAKPGDRAVVHHICVFLEEPNRIASGKSIRDSLLVAYAPGDRPSVFPEGVGKRIPRGSDLLFEVHYTPIGKPRFDRSSVGLVLSTEMPKHLASTKGIPAHNLRIPPGDPDYVVRTFWKADRDLQLLSMTPHMHLRGKSFTFSAEYPDGRTEILLSVPRYDFNWQSAYRLADPKSIPKGTKIHCEAHFDNSSGNPANPDPTRTVLWGEQSEDEMMIGFIDYY